MKNKSIIYKYKICAAALAAGVCLVTLFGCSAGQSGQATGTVSGAASVQQTAATVTPPSSATPTASVKPTASVSPSATPSASDKPSASDSPAAANVSKPTAAPSGGSSGEPLAGLVIGLDPGHQAKEDNGLEPVAPGSSDMKPKVSSGTEGVKSKVPEYVVNLNVALKLRDMLQAAGATVVMTHTTADVDISNKQRAQIFNDKKVDLGIRIHANGIDDSSVHGAFMLVPESNPFEADCKKAAQLIIDNYTKTTGIKELGTEVRSDQTGFNWCTRPIVNIEMGHMSNPAEDLKITDKDFQTTMAQGIYNGILAYFKQK